MAKVHVITPMRGTLRAELAQFREVLLASERRFELVIGLSDAQPCANNRNRIVKRFLEDEKADYLFTIDSDQCPAGFNPLDYVLHDLDIVGFPSPTVRINDDPPIRWFPGPPSDVGLVEVEDVSGGCLLVARRVLEHPGMRAAFSDEWDADGLRTCPEDSSFTRRARICGFEIWCAMNRRIYHWKVAEMATLWEWAMRQRAHDTDSAADFSG